MKNKVGERFSEFYEKWVCQLDEYVQLLLKVSKEINCDDHQLELQDLVSKVTQHYREYFTVKWSLAHEDVLAFFCPIWVSPFENANLWVSDWKPSMIFKLIGSTRTTTRVPAAGSSLAEMTTEQLGKMQELRVKIRLDEEKVEREMERQQVGMGDRKMVELARLTSRVVLKGSDMVMSRVDGIVEVALKREIVGLEKVMKAADCVRLRTLKRVLDVLNPWQCVEFLVGISMLQIRLRQWGKQREGSSYIAIS